MERKDFMAAVAALGATVLIGQAEGQGDRRNVCSVAFENGTTLGLTVDGPGVSADDQELAERAILAWLIRKHYPEVESPIILDVAHVQSMLGAKD